jgi:hypothetical protein
MINIINNLPERLHEYLYTTDQRYKSLIIQFERAKQCQDEEQKDLVLQTIHTEYGEQYV